MFIMDRIVPRCFHSLFPRLVQVTSGGGLPVALHESVKFSFSVAVWLLEIEIIVGRSIKIEVRGLSDREKASTLVDVKINLI